MSLAIVNGVTLLVAILASTLVASQSVLPSASSAQRHFTRQVDYGDYSYVDEVTTPCANYCYSHSLGAYHCCPPPVVSSGGGLTDCATHSVGCTGIPIVNQIDCTTNGVGCTGIPRVNQIDCTTNGVGCTGVPRGNPIDCTTNGVGCEWRYKWPVSTQAPIIYRPPKVTRTCGFPHCNPTYPGIVHEVPVVHQEPVIHTSPNYVCNNQICNPVRPYQSTVCSGSRCHQPPQLPIRPLSTACKLPDLVQAVNQLVFRSYARAYTERNFIDGIEGIIDNHWRYSWYGQCIAPGKIQSTEDSENVDVFEVPDITAADCRPCSTSHTGTRRCSTRFQTVLGACDSCCHRSVTRNRRSVVNKRRDLREAVAQLMGRAHTMNRHGFIAKLQAILRNAAQGVYSWNQTVLVQGPGIQPQAWTPTDREALDEKTTLQPTTEVEAVLDKSGQDNDSVGYEYS